MQSFSMVCISAVLLMMPIWPAQSDKFPVLNVLPLCRGITSQGADPLQAGDRSVTLQQCLDAEQQDRETMKSEWSTFSASDRKHCIAEATMGGEFELYRTCHLSRNGPRRQEAKTIPRGF